MKKNQSFLVVLFGVIFLLAVSMAFAGNKNNNTQQKSENNKVATSEKTTAKQMNQNQTIEQNQETKKICFETRDGKKYTWQNKYNKKLMKYDQQGTQKKMHKYLYRIARRIKIEDPQDIEEFIQWAFQTKPWTNNEME